jgi:hypothetical protein
VKWGPEHHADVNLQAKYKGKSKTACAIAVSKGISDFAQLIADYKVKTEEAAAAAAAAAGSGGDAGRAQQQQTACAIAVSKGRSDLAQLIADYRATEQGVSPSYGWLFHRQNHGL